MVRLILSVYAQNHNRFVIVLEISLGKQAQFVENRFYDHFRSDRRNELHQPESVVEQAMYGLLWNGE
ncbi:hypothetical protein GF407_00170 [candidate division KSB1 bacterium]|nr:hypothetical protein [candidate division KSB1 bacterium]